MNVVFSVGGKVIIDDVFDVSDILLVRRAHKDEGEGRRGGNREGRMMEGERCSVVKYVIHTCTS